MITVRIEVRHGAGEIEVVETDTHTPNSEGAYTRALASLVDRAHKRALAAGLANVPEGRES